MGSQFKFTYFILQEPNCESGGEYDLSIHKIRAHEHLNDPPNRSLDSYGLDKTLEYNQQHYIKSKVHASSSLYHIQVFTQPK